MKYLIAALVLLATASGTRAGDVAAVLTPSYSLGSASNQTQSAASQSAGGSISGSNIGNPSLNFEGSKIVPGPAPTFLTAAEDTCMGSTGGSVTTSVIGVSYGTTWKDPDCVMRKNARELWNMGMRAAAIARLCMDPLNNKALQQTGYQCPTSDPIALEQ